MKYAVGTILTWGPFDIEVKGIADDHYWMKWEDGTFRTFTEEDLNGWEMRWFSMTNIYQTMDRRFSLDSEEDYDYHVGFLIYWTNGETEFRTGYCGDAFWKLKVRTEEDFPF